MKNIKITLFIVTVFAAGLLIFAGPGCMDAGEAENTLAEPEASEELYLIEEVIQILEAEYLDEVDRDELIEGALEGMLEKLDDPYTGYMTPEDFENLMIDTRGTYGGVGIEVTEEDDYITVISAISGTPGEEAGLSSGDRIIAVDGENLVGEGLNKAVSLMRGEPGTDLVLEVERPGVGEVLEFAITREKIELETVEHEMHEGNLGYIKLTSFSETSVEEFDAALEELGQEGMAGLIIDVRDNPGGLLDAAIQIADRFIAEGPITHVEGGEGGVETYRATAEALDLPLVVLVNEVSSSGSEVLAGALQDSGTATLVGQETFGKASVQNIRQLTNGGALRYTMAHYMTPDKRAIHEEGLTPDVAVDPPDVVKLAREPISTDLARGDEGETVETLQKLLSEFGYFDGDVDGYFDDATESALEEFQADQGIHVTVEMNDMVVRKLHEEVQRLKKEQDTKLEKALELLAEKLN